MKSDLQTLLYEAREKGKLSGRLKFDVAMSRYTTWRIGGNAECVYQPESVADLQTLLTMLPEETPVNWIGLGSNLLIRDGGLEGVVINTNGVLNRFSVQCDEMKCFITAQAGVACAIFSRKAANEGINGAEFLSGIPGTIGGALAMNAGAFGGETWRYVTNVTMINRKGEIINRTPDDFDIHYRDIALKKTVLKKMVLKKKSEQEWFLSGHFCFEKDEQGLAQSKQEIKRLLARRAETQPTKQANAGSVFKNPENDFAARLIESCGLKGQSINDAQISEKHANFIINKGNARASDVEALIELIQETVFKQHHVKLETEVRFMGQP